MSQLRKRSLIVSNWKGVYSSIQTSAGVGSNRGWCSGTVLDTRAVWSSAFTSSTMRLVACLAAWALAAEKAVRISLGFCQQQQQHTHTR